MIILMIDWDHNLYHAMLSCSVDKDDHFFFKRRNQFVIDIIYIKPPINKIFDPGPMFVWARVATIKSLFKLLSQQGWLTEMTDLDYSIFN